MSHQNKTFSLILLITMSILLSRGVTLFSAVSMENSLEADAATETIQSDDFDDSTLAPFWTHEQGRAGDPAPVLNGTQLLITAPAGIVHDIWYNGVQANRILQPMEAGDFEVEVKFASSMDSGFQMQGIIVENDDGNALRFEIYHNGTDYYLHGASIIGADRTRWINHRIKEDGNPMYMRVGRVGDTWTLSYSLDGETWKSGETEDFELAFEGTWIGLYAGNAEDGTTGEVPEHTAVFDYFYNMASPCLGDIPLLTTNTSGSGTITKEPDQATYDCNQEVVLTAVNDPGWEFSGWSGDLTGNDNPATIILNSSKSVTATFVEEKIEEFVFLPGIMAP